MTVLALSSGAFVFLAFVLVLLAGLVATTHARNVRGTGITQRPHDGSDAAPGAEGASRIDRDPVDDVGIDTHGTR
jgi:hypothetical protein